MLVLLDVDQSQFVLLFLGESSSARAVYYSRVGRSVPLRERTVPQLLGLASFIGDGLRVETLARGLEENFLLASRKRIMGEFAVATQPGLF